MLRATLLFALLGHAHTAAAQDLSTALENWVITADGTAGNDGEDVAEGVVIDSAGHVVVVGRVDGATDFGSDAFVHKYDSLGNLVWDVYDARGPVSGTKPVADDVFWDVEVDTADQICLVGQVSGDTAVGYETGYYVAKLTDYDGSVTFDDTWRDGSASTNQAGRGITLDAAGDLNLTGWSFRHPNQQGQWATHRYVGTTGLRDLGPVYYDVTNDPFAIDQAYDIAVDSQGNLIVVGAVGVGGATGPDDANRDVHVRKIDPAGPTLLWEYTWGGAAGLEDAATGVVVDSVGEITVVGYTNKGSDNGANADYDWLMIRLDSAGSAGYGNEVWSASWQDTYAAGAKEQLFDAHLHENGTDIVVGGTWDDGGDAAWRVAVISWIDGSEVGAWAWPAAAGGDSVLRAIDVRDRTVVAAGSVWNGADHDIQVAMLDPDDDGDGFGNRAEACPNDPLKQDEGECGCGNPDVDSDYDTFLDCDDACPQLPEKWLDEGICGCDETDEDRDGDDTPDCIDNCPDDPNKISLGECGCGLLDNDSDGDGVLGCDDACSNTPAGTPVDEFGCPVEDCTNGVDDNNNGDVDCDDFRCDDDPACATSGGGDGEDEKGCGCSSAPTPTGLLALGLVALAARRRREAP